MPIDHVGSTVNLAKQLRMDLDLSAEFFKINPHTFKMLLDTLIDLGEPNVPVMQTERAKTVAESIIRAGG